MVRTQEDLLRLWKETVRRFPGPHVKLFRSWKVGFSVSKGALAYPDNAIHGDSEPLAYSVPEEDGSILVCFSRDLLSLPEDVCRYLMAHELAHLALFHVHWGLSGVDLYNDEEVLYMRRVFEEQADWFVVHICGMEAEAKRAAEILGCTCQLTRRWESV